MKKAVQTLYYDKENLADHGFATEQLTIWSGFNRDEQRKIFEDYVIRRLKMESMAQKAGEP